MNLLGSIHSFFLYLYLFNRPGLWTATGPRATLLAALTTEHSRHGIFVCEFLDEIKSEIILTGGSWCYGRYES